MKKGAREILHVVVAVTDRGAPPLTRYQRVISLSPNGPARARRSV
jgi:hypothetical protein